MDPSSPTAPISARYRIGGVLGRGGAGTTYAAERLTDGASVAIKELDLSRAGDWKRVELFEREARVLAGLGHPGIPRYLEVAREEREGRPVFYLVQERARGRTLAEHVAEGWRADEARVRHVGAELLRILVYLQSLSPPVIHRDIKPQNVLMTEDGTVSLVDFGAARDQLRPEGEASTVVGTYGYMAPEQFRGHAVPATDLYGVGATLLFLLTRRPAAELPQHRLAIQFRPLVQVSPELASWLERMVAPSPEDRFDSAKTALMELLHPTPAREAAPPWRVGLLAGILGVVSIAGAAGFWWMSRPPPMRGQLPAGSVPSASRPAPSAAAVVQGPRPIKTLSGHWSAVFGLAWTSDGARVVSGSWDQTVKLWDVQKGETIRSFAGQSGKIGAVAVTKDDRLLVAGADTTVRVWDLASGQQVRALPPHPAQLTSLALSQDERSLVASSADGTVRVSKLETGETVRTLQHKGRVLAVATTPRHVITGGDDKVVRVFELEDGREVASLTGHAGPVNKLAVAPDGQTLASASDDGTVKIWVIDPGKLMRTLEGHGPTEVWSVAFGADGKTVATGTKDDVLRIWDAFSGKLVMTTRGGVAGVISLAFAPDGRRLAAGGGNNLVHIWSLGDPTWHPPLAEATPPRAAAGQIPASASEAERLTLQSRARLAQYHGRSEVLQEAKALAERAIAVDARYAPAHAQLARVTYQGAMRRSNDYDAAGLDAAMVHADRALEIDPKSVDGYLAKGWIYKLQKKTDLAREMARKADALEPSSPRAALLLGELAMAANDYDEAMRRARVVLDSPADPTLRAQAYDLLGDVYRRLHDWEGADICYRSMINLEPDNAWSKGNFAHYLVRRGETDRAIEMAKSALAQMDYGAGRWTLASAYAQRTEALAAAGKLDEAAQAARAAMEAAPTSAGAQLAAGYHHRAVGLAEKNLARMAQAETAFSRALALEPTNAQAKKALEEHPALVERVKAGR